MGSGGQESPFRGGHDHEHSGGVEEQHGELPRGDEDLVEVGDGGASARGIEQKTGAGRPYQHRLVQVSTCAGAGRRRHVNHDHVVS